MPVDIARTNPLTFRMDDGSLREFKGFVMVEGPDTTEVMYRQGCVVRTFGFNNHNTTAGQIYQALTGLSYI